MVGETGWRDGGVRRAERKRAEMRVAGESMAHAEMGRLEGGGRKSRKGTKGKEKEKIERDEK